MGKKKIPKKTIKKSQTSTEDEDDFDEVTFANMVKYFKKNKFDFILLCTSLVCLITLSVAAYAMYRVYLDAKEKAGYKATPEGVNNTMVKIAGILSNNINRDQLAPLINNIEFGLGNNTIKSYIINANLRNSFTTKIITYLSKFGNYNNLESNREFIVRIIDIVNKILISSPDAIVCIPQYPINLMLECSNQNDIYNSLQNLIKTIISKPNCEQYAVEYISQAGIIPSIDKKAIVLDFLTNHTSINLEKSSKIVCKFVSAVIEEIDLWTNDIPDNLCKLQKVVSCDDFKKIDMDHYCMPNEL